VVLSAHSELKVNACVVAAVRLVRLLPPDACV
jgi:hypothetical protein